MLSKFEIAIIVLLVVNVLATIYFNYRSQEDYAARQINWRPEYDQVSSVHCNGKGTTEQCIKSTLQAQYKSDSGRTDWKNHGAASDNATIDNTIARAANILTTPLRFGKDGSNSWGMCVNANCKICGPGSYKDCRTCLSNKC